MSHLETDARNRALRSFLTGLAIDIAVGIALVLTTYFAAANSWGAIEWTVLGFSLFKSVVQAVGAFILRRYVDASSVPTPLPPANPGVPRDEAGAVDVGTAVLIALLVLVLLVALGFLPLAR